MLLYKYDALKNFRLTGAPPPPRRASKNKTAQMQDTTDVPKTNISEYVEPSEWSKHDQKFSVNPDAWIFFGKVNSANGSHQICAETHFHKFFVNANQELTLN